jgi:hypothetical protein
MVQLRPVFGACPVTAALRRELRVLFQGVMPAVEEILAVKLYKREKNRQK